jgi:serine/threonine protein kinase
MTTQRQTPRVEALLAFNTYGELGRVKYDPEKKLGSGATAGVYKCSIDSEPSVVHALKLYNPDRAVDVKKIMAMLEKSPQEGYKPSELEDSNLFCWPTALVKDRAGLPRGIVMPLIEKGRYVPLDYYYDSALSKKLRSPDETALTFRLEIALNLAEVVEQLHSHGHFFIDFKPQNIWVSQSNHKIVFLDCDGFSIGGVNGERYPADLISTDYISPEAFTGALKPRDLGLEQDLYALAVIIFQLMNYGAHPFQGVITKPNIEAATNDEKAYKGLYPHGVDENDSIVARPGSTHRLVHKRLRKLFDEAFTSVSRPSAKLWAKTIQELLEQKSIVRCRDFPTKPTHMRFRTLGCPECQRTTFAAEVRERRVPGRRKDRSSDTVAITKGSARQGVVASATPSRNYLVPKQGGFEGSLWLLGITVALVGIVFFGMSAEPDVNRSTQQTTLEARAPAMGAEIIELARVNFFGRYADSCTAKRSDPGFREHTLFISPDNRMYWRYQGESNNSESWIKNLELKQAGGTITGFKGDLVNLANGAAVGSVEVLIGADSFRVMRYVDLTTGYALILNGFYLNSEGETRFFVKCYQR